MWKEVSPSIGGHEEAGKPSLQVYTQPSPEVSVQTQCPIFLALPHIDGPCAPLQYTIKLQMLSGRIPEDS